MPHHVNFELTVSPGVVFTVFTFVRTNIFMEIHVSVDIRVRGEVLATERTGKHLPSVVQGRGLTDLVPIDRGIHNRKSGVSSGEGSHLPAISRHVVPTKRGATITGGPLDLGHPH